MTQKVIPNIWFNGNAQEAVNFYMSTFPDIQIVTSSYYPKSRKEGLADFQLNLAGKVLTIDFELMGFHFVAINAGSEFTPNPSISFFVTLDSKNDIDKLWGKLVAGGSELMALSKYPFSEYYGWVQDKYNVSWQLILNNSKDNQRPKIIPSLLFTQDKNGLAEESITFYTSIFENSNTAELLGSTENDQLTETGSLVPGECMLGNTRIAAMNGGQGHDFKFNEGVSLLINCKDQDEIDYYWEKLSANGGEQSVCGWLKDKFGVSWQIAPANMEELMKNPNAFKILLNQKKIIISEYLP